MIRTLALVASALLLLPSASSLGAQERLDRGRFTFLYSERDRGLASSLAEHALATDTFPGLPRPAQKVTIAIAADARRFRELAGEAAPEWGSAVAFPDSRRIVLQGQRAGADAGNPLVVLRHELAHLALHEYLGNLPPRWFDEGYASYAAGEWGREQVLATNLALAFGGLPTLDELDDEFTGGATAAQSAYALAWSAVLDLAHIDQQRGLSLFFSHWRTSRTMDLALRRSHATTLADFEAAWRRRVRLRYGALALVGNVAVVGLLLLVVLTPFYVARRRRDRQRLEQMRRADAAAEAAEKAALDELLGGS